MPQPRDFARGHEIVSIELHYIRRMPGGPGPSPRKRSFLSYAPVRWSLAASIAAGVTAVLFIGMTRLIDGSWILDQVLRVFPLEQTAAVDPCKEWQAEQTLVPVEGTVGYLGPTGFVALPDARIMGEHVQAPSQHVEVSAAGTFRFVTPFEAPRPESCGEPASRLGPSPRLLIQAPDCSARTVPVTRNWLPHRVLLDCEERS